MDPNITLREIRTISARIIRNCEDESGNGIDQEDAYDLANCIKSLDEWLSLDGFLPGDWEVK